MKTLERKKLSETTPLPSLKMNERLKVVRQSRDMTQQEMADLIGTSRPSIAQLEAGRHQPSNEALETIVAKLGISRNWLWFGSGPMEEFSPLGGNVKVLAGLEEGDYLDIEFIGCKVRGSFLDLMDDGGEVSQFESPEIVRIYDPTPEMRKPGTKGFEIDGDSMEPQLRSGMKVVGVRVALADVKYATSGVYVVAFGNQLTIKRVKSNDILERGILMLHADNPNAGSLPVAAEDIRFMWRVVRIFYADVI
ncbi:helix-turn-helix domain-containing protein [Hymenobacter sp. DH14]|uniref:Helix-turn-helix domain-containing protein n=1 Tax=Hymenobacter cyanobacteriorum TaxID=2926463 RepID=A0A9X2AHF0_9BACT|nr:XRE family transcriptional regulator [Hymenobacter cyanobacteriorum]MCI1188753.1 helix-turn-helix domain-containing protein [Hymenobacter cyanobacteriorum]